MGTKKTSTDKPRFVRYKEDGTGLFFFKYVDQNDNALLIADKGYLKVKNRDYGIKKIKAPTSYTKVIEDNGKFYFLVKAGGNHAKLGISPNFETKADAEKAGNALMEMINKPRARKIEVKNEKKSIKNSSPRQVFRLTFYPSEKAEEMIGNIEHILTDKKKNLRGLDMTVIQKFVEDNLQIKASKPSDKRSKKTMDKKIAKTDFKNETVELTFMMEGHKLEGNTANHTQQVDLQIEVTQEDNISEDFFDVFVFAKSMKTREKTLTGQIRGVNKKQHKLSIPLNLQNLEVGPYRIISSIEWYGNSLQGFGKKNISESSYLLVV